MTDAEVCDLVFDALFGRLCLGRPAQTGSMQESSRAIQSRMPEVYPGRMPGYRPGEQPCRL
jgi:hypothetical protein